MISAGTIGGGAGEPTPPLAYTPTAMQPQVIQPPPTASVNSAGAQVSLPMEPAKLTGEQTTQLVDLITRKLSWWENPTTVNGITGVIGQGIQLIGTFFNAWFTGRAFDLQDAFRKDMREIADKKLGNELQLGELQLGTQEKIAASYEKGREAEARNQRIGAVEIAEVRERGLTERTALTRLDDVFGMGRSSYPYGLPVG